MKVLSIPAIMFNLNRRIGSVNRRKESANLRTCNEASKLALVRLPLWDRSQKIELIHLSAHTPDSQTMCLRIFPSKGFQQMLCQAPWRPLSSSPSNALRRLINLSAPHFKKKLNNSPMRPRKKWRLLLIVINQLSIRRGKTFKTEV